jgi:glycosyltransferase involved in cell wall biosynthesis
MPSRPTTTFLKSKALPMIDRFLLAIPVHNEARYVASVLERVRRFAPSILVVDDGSTDATPDLLREERRERNLEVITHSRNLGYGRTIADAFAYAYEHRDAFDWVITMDCDEQHEPEEIPRFLGAIAEDDADIISGTRYPQGHLPQAGVPDDRRRINAYLTQLIGHRLGLPITDAFCGFKAYRVDSLQHFHITEPGYAMPMQWWVQVARANLRVREVAVALRYPDPGRVFGGNLDDPRVRLTHYLRVFQSALAEEGVASCLDAVCRAG